MSENQLPAAQQQPTFFQLLGSHTISSTVQGLMLDVLPIIPLTMIGNLVKMSMLIPQHPAMPNGISSGLSISGVAKQSFMSFAAATFSYTLRGMAHEYKENQVMKDILGEYSQYTVPLAAGVIGGAGKYALGHSLSTLESLPRLLDSLSGATNGLLYEINNVYKLDETSIGQPFNSTDQNILAHAVSSASVIEGVDGILGGLINPNVPLLVNAMNGIIAGGSIGIMVAKVLIPSLPATKQFSKMMMSIEQNLQAPAPAIPVSDTTIAKQTQDQNLNFETVITNNYLISAYDVNELLGQNSTTGQE